MGGGLVPSFFNVFSSRLMLYFYYSAGIHHLHLAHEHIMTGGNF